MVATLPPRMRRLVNKAFTPRRVESMRPMLRELTTRLLDEMEKHDEIDLLEALAYPVPMELLCTLLGVPAVLDEFYPATPPPPGSRPARNCCGVRPE